MTKHIDNFDLWILVFVDLYHIILIYSWFLPLRLFLLHKFAGFYNILDFILRECFSLYVGQPDIEYNSWLAITIYMEHKTGLLFKILLLIYIILERFYFIVFLSNLKADFWHRFISVPLLQLFIFVAAEYETPKNALNQVSSRHLSACVFWSIIVLVFVLSLIL